MAINFIIIFIIGSFLFYGIHRLTRYGFSINSLLILATIIYLFKQNPLLYSSLEIILHLGCPLVLSNTILYVFFQKEEQTTSTASKYEVNFKLNSGKFKINNIKRGASIIGAAGSGKTESVVYGFLDHFRRHLFCGVIHDYKDFEVTEMAYPLFKNSDINFYIISFDKIFHRVNPIAPRYLENEESVN